MTAVAIYSKDPKLRSELARRLRDTTTVVIAEASDDLQTLTQLMERNQINILLADSPRSDEQKDLQQHGASLIALVEADDHDAALEALQLGATSILPRSAEGREIAAAIDAAKHGLAILPRTLIDLFLEIGSPGPDQPSKTMDAEHPKLTAREIEVLTAIADGMSNKAIARRLGISFHTVKFHVAALLTKLEADTRAEAVAKAAHLGLIML
jgi:DNA-binding NarL/FixJ family response regulator